jgi:DNA-binding response OmpR family regulator
MAREDNPTILLADRFEDARRMLAILLETQGYATVECDGAESTIAAADRWSPDAILLATTSHDDELDIVHELRRRHGAACAPIILVTGFQSAEFRSRAMAAGCAGCLLIPIDFSEVLAQLARVLGDSAHRVVVPRLDDAPAGVTGTALPPARRSERRSRVRAVRPAGHVARVEKLAGAPRSRRRSR